MKEPAKYKRLLFQERFLSKREIKNTNKSLSIAGAFVFCSGLFYRPKSIFYIFTKVNLN